LKLRINEKLLRTFKKEVAAKQPLFFALLPSAFPSKDGQGLKEEPQPANCPKSIGSLRQLTDRGQ
jgi:hypothetical protein